MHVCMCVCVCGGGVWTNALACFSCMKSRRAPFSYRPAFLGRYLTEHWICNEIGQPLPCGNFWDEQTCPAVRCFFEEWNCLPNTDPEGEDDTTVVPTSSASLPTPSDGTPAATDATAATAATTVAAAASTVSMITSAAGEPTSCDSHADEDACMVMAGATCFWEWQTGECRDHRCADEWDVDSCNVRQPRRRFSRLFSSCTPVRMPWSLLYLVRMPIGC